MSYGAGILDYLLTLFLSEGAMMGAAVLLLVSMVVFFRSRGRRGLRVTCGVLMACCVLYLALIAALSVLFSSGHP